jgi:Eukaryotic aspartyl protease
LGPFDSNKAKANSLNFLEDLTARRKLKSNPFSLLLPSDTNPHSQLLIGDILRQYADRPFTNIPINEERSFKFGVWQSQVSSITFEDKTTYWNNSYLGFNVHFSIAPVILFPDDITATIIKRAEEFRIPGREIECKKRLALPNVTLDVETGRPLVLTGFDYTIITSLDGSICSIVVVPIKGYHKRVPT